MKPWPANRSSLCLALVVSCTAATAAPAPEIWPVPQRYEARGPDTLPVVRLEPASMKPFPSLVEACVAKGIRPTGTIRIRTATGTKVEPFLREAGVKPVKGSYLLTVGKDAITIAAPGESGLFYATQTLAQMIAASGELPHCRIADWPDLPFRGSIEGFYGKPWEHERRLSQIRFYGRFKMNGYVYGPKDDPYSGFNSPLWREPYPEDKASQIIELVDTAKAHHVHFVWALHPGGNIRWDDGDGDGIADDILVAQQKLEAMYRLGVRSFAIFFDDIGGEGARAGMQATMLNHINREFIRKKDGVTPLIMCPTDYAGSHGSDYKRELGAALDEDIDIMWTGPGICSEIPADSVQAVSAHWRRKPFIWWNWPVNDYCRTNLLLGRTYGLDKGNKGLLAGFAANPMDKPEASKIGLFSIANWSWNVDAFESGGSWRAAFPQLYRDPEVAAAMFTFAKHNSDQGPNTHGFRREESTEIKPVVDEALQQYRNGRSLDPRHAGRLDGEFAAIASAAELLQQRLPDADPALWHEIEFWVKSFAALGSAGRAAIELASDKTSDPASRAVLFSAICTAKAQQKIFHDAQKQRHFDETFPSDKRWSRGCKVATHILTPLVDEILTSEWAGFHPQNKDENPSRNAIYKAFSNANDLQNLQCTREGIFVSLEPVLEVVKLAPGDYIGLALPEQVHANYIHVELDQPEAARACAIEVSTDASTWTTFEARRGGGEIQNPVDVAKRIRFFRMINRSGKPIGFRIRKFKFDVPEDSEPNSPAAVTDGDPLSAFTIRETATFTGPDGSRPVLVTDAPPGAIRNQENKVTLTAPQGQAVRLFEIFWK